MYISTIFIFNILYIFLYRNICIIERYYRLISIAQQSFIQRLRHKQYQFFVWYLGTRYHSPYTTSTGTQSSASNERFASISPTPEASSNVHRGGNSSYQNTKSTVDKYLVSKSVQSGYDRYAVGGQNDHQFGQDRYFASSGSSDRFQATSGAERFHAPADRYSPARSVTDKYLSLPKPKDRFTGRITPISCATSVVATSSTDRTYGSSSTSYVPPTAHTPVERYVPQPPPEVLYPDR